MYVQVGQLIYTWKIQFAEPARVVFPSPTVSRNDAKRIAVTLRRAKEVGQLIYTWKIQFAEPARVVFPSPTVSRNDAKRIAVTLRRAKEGSHSCM
ncbi:hypothetical protein CDAR_509601 [Caerostris darwini]|uniref:Uncharacterized protein n=1 Tax=Caerostris darwini TaxID=1538125 RepID=A0AAV4QZ18_9ARAC|nr:hypothetical protein CDAR_509601 [Caerostris darwini]